MLLFTTQQVRAIPALSKSSFNQYTVFTSSSHPLKHILYLKERLNKILLINFEYSISLRKEIAYEYS